MSENAVVSCRSTWEPWEESGEMGHGLQGIMTGLQGLLPGHQGPVVGRKEGKGNQMERRPVEASETQTIAPDLSKSLKQFQLLFFIYRMEATTPTEKQAVRIGSCQGELCAPSICPRLRGGAGRKCNFCPYLCPSFFKNIYSCAYIIHNTLQ